MDAWARSFAALGINYRGALMRLDLCDRKGKYSNGERRVSAGSVSCSNCSSGSTRVRTKRSSSSNLFLLLANLHLPLSLSPSLSTRVLPLASLRLQEDQWGVGAVGHQLYLPGLPQHDWQREECAGHADA